MTTFKALVVQPLENGTWQQQLQSLPLSFLPDNEVEVEVLFSSLNYKDALSAFGKNNITKSYPHITGIDAAGKVVSDKTNTFSKGDEVLVMGYDLGMNTHGGHATRIRVPTSWVVKKPQHLSLYESMCLGTAGFTVGLAWLKMQPYVEVVKQGDFLVTGASGGVGSFAIALFAHEGVSVTACSSKKGNEQKLLDLGASSVIPAAEILIPEGKPLVKPKWSGALDNLGGRYMASLLASTHKEGCVVSVGLASSMELHTTVLPFILNGINLIGINAADTLMKTRTAVWNYLGTVKDAILPQLKDSLQTISLAELPAYMQQMLVGGMQGRIVVDVQYT